MKILHIASFIGNLGDLLSHHALHRFLRRSFGEGIEIETLEIRRFHKNASADIALHLDDVLPQLDGKYDRIIIGGGGFLDYWVPNSQTGTSIDVSAKTLERLRTPLLISSVGAYPLREPPVENHERFRRFLEVIGALSNIQLMLRNDGSREHIIEHFSSDLVRDVPECGDHCYLLRPQDEAIPPARRGRYIAVNLAPDQVPMQSHLRSGIDPDIYYRGIAEGLFAAAEAHSADIVFVPHLPVDFKAVTRIVEHFSDAFMRSRFHTDGFDGGFSAIPSALSTYAHSIANVSGRLHSNIASFVLEKPTVSLGVLSRVVALTQQHPSAALVGTFDGGLRDRIVEGVDRAITSGGDDYASTVRSKIEAYLLETLEGR